MHGDPSPKDFERNDVIDNYMIHMCYLHSDLWTEELAVESLF